MEAMGLIAIVVNCYLIGQCGQLQRLFPWLSPEMAIISIVILEHFAILLKYVIHVAIPDIPTWVREEIAKLDYQRREAFKVGTTGREEQTLVGDPRGETLDTLVGDPRDPSGETLETLVGDPRDPSGETLETLKHERQAQQHYQQLQRRKREEEERQRQAEHMARRERERDDGKADAPGEQHHEKGHGGKSRGGGAGGGAGGAAGGAGGGGADKPKRPSSLMAANNVMKLKQIIPLQSKFSAGGARSPQSPTEPKLPGFLSFKFLKSPDNKKEGAAASGAAANANATAAASGGGAQERSQSPSKAFNPGKLFNFGKSDGGACVNGTADRTPSKADLNGVPEEMPSPGGEGPQNGHAADASDPPGSKV
ncbi:Anoctamin-8 [Liparis tanakae]|uniref:Anoctamin n=1 Tax=Liparis tanakae TaxID=230148 RepID=A0A4Z2IK33_9TELE|nr:Anoctamin-8 [Liparis tanakae]